jgi:hypothetical protein
MFYIIIEKETARQILQKAPGVVIIDGRELNSFPTPLGVCSLSLNSITCSCMRVRVQRPTFVLNMGFLSVINVGIKQR